MTIEETITIKTEATTLAHLRELVAACDHIEEDAKVVVFRSSNSYSKTGGSITITGKPKPRIATVKKTSHSWE